MPEILKTDTIILRTRNYNDADQLLTIFTQKAGKLTAIVKGVKKPKSKLRGGVQVFSHTNLSLYLGKSLATVTQAATINTFASLREDLLRMAYASYLTELLDSLTPENEADTRLFVLILKGLHLLSVEDPWLITKVMEARLLTATGYQPQLETCVNCGGKTELSGLFVIEQGGIICTNCNHKNINIMKISGETQVLLKQLVELELNKVHRLRISPRAKSELEEILDLYITYCLGKQLKSKQFIQHLA